MLIHRKTDILPSEITPKQKYLERRDFIRSAALGTAAALAGGAVTGLLADNAWAQGRGTRLPDVKKGSPFDTDEKMTPYDAVTRYNNFYEFGTAKDEPARLSRDFQPRPWSVRVDGECGKPGDVPLENLLVPHQLEERIYRLRCVEAWSMVVPWVGIPLGDVLRRFEPNGNAGFVHFETLEDKARMPGQISNVIDWPYVEGLRMDEAMHPLAILAVGLYGEVLPNQNGAPLRLIVPWKYGFKSIKSIVRISFTRSQPSNSWAVLQPREYGFYANVNPEVDHPRWSQAREQRLDGSLLPKRIETQMFNGYGDEVASLYSGMDLRKYF
jgi:sulfoxide reductase catalytic subunit YedY